jgi:hypothetical protein
MTAKNCFDAKCLDLAIYFYPAASADRLNDLAQRIQNEVESEDLDASAQETRASTDACCCGPTCKLKFGIDLDADEHCSIQGPTANRGETL